ncbi:MAG: biotin/lipoyl-binding protein [Roseiflexus sp.]|nr:biotin/lipoyl-binding protein [Roseiflexus sp.]MCS7291111.1 biotin/lipoyl-binding protein [Roseiflexus sp.]MDW8145856.1 biotin/lipoyl-binding protein [Roseiflexaceae bacterium]
MRKIIAGIILIGSIILSACGSIASAPPTPETWTLPPATATPAPTAIPTPTRLPWTTYTVQRGTIERSVELQGRVASAGERELSFAVDGVVKAVYVTPNAEIRKGQVLAELESGELKDRLTQVQRQYAQAQRQLERALDEKQFPLRRAEIDLEAARAALAQLLTPPDPARIAAARAAVQQAEAARDRARNDASAVKTRAELALRQAQKRLIAAQAEFSAALHAAEQDKADNKAQERLARAGDALRAAEEEVARLQIEYDTARNNEIAAVQAAEAQVVIAQAALDELLRGPDPLKVAEAQRNVALAELAVEQARSAIQVDPTLERAVEEAKKDVEDIQRQIEALKLVARFDGRILTVNIAPGAVVRAGEPAFVALDPSVAANTLEVLVTSSSAPLVVGQPVSITFARYPGATYQGRVTGIPGSGSNGAVSGYRIAYEPTDLKLVSGDAAIVTAVLERRENALWLPPKAIRADSRSYVLVQRGDRPERVDIETGLITPDRVEILSGLKEGDVVIGQ